jgi:hypothetical protein
MKITSSHTYEAMTPEMRPQDPAQNGSGLTFETLEHDEMTMPQAIRVTDAEGRWCVYEPVRIEGEVVRSHGYETREA